MGEVHAGIDGIDWEVYLSYFLKVAIDTFERYPMGILRVSEGSRVMRAV
ncbi:hypothetical protein [Cyclobacterium roseum]|nr:hypothetical protein [Cyclobacterium roseum]